MKLNPKKHMFGVKYRKFSCMVRKRGIQANPKKVKVILNMLKPKSNKDVQQQARRLETLLRFISKSFEKSKTFFKALKDEKGR